MSLSLLAIMRDDPDLSKRIEQGKREIEENKKHLLKNAADYSEIYRKEIEEGTKKKQLLLEDGEKRGLKEEDVLKEYGKFIPSDETPIMNFLYFLMRDGEHRDWIGVQKELNEMCGHADENLSFALSEKELDEIIGWLEHEDEKYENVSEPEDIDKFIYGEMKHSTFVRIKKLKALTKSPNTYEACLAYQLCLKFCNRYGLDFGKIPCYVE